MAKWMSSKGARDIVLVSRKASVNDKVQGLIDELATKGTRVIVKACDVGSRQSVESLVKEQMKDLPPVRGVVHGAMVLRVSPAILLCLLLFTDIFRTCSLRI